MRHPWASLVESEGAALDVYFLVRAIPLDGYDLLRRDLQYGEGSIDLTHLCAEEKAS